MTVLTDLTIAAARDGLKAKKLSARELAEAHVKAMDGVKELGGEMFVVDDGWFAKGKVSPPGFGCWIACRRSEGGLPRSMIATAINRALAWRSPSRSLA